MNTQTALTVAPALELTATTPLEMQESQTALIAWCEKKIEVMKHEASELAENLAIAIKNKWKSATLKRHAQLALKRVTFYEKIKAALEAGYCIVPNFPIDLFAIRTDRKKPNRKLHIGTYAEGAWHFKQQSGKLPVGEGEYVSPNPLVRTYKDEIKQPDGTMKKKVQEEATDFDEVAFPIQMAKPKIMETVGRAMALKVFDQFGLFAQGTGDPIITGEIVSPDSQATNPTHMKKITFMVAWHIDVRDL